MNEEKKKDIVPDKVPENKDVVPETEEVPKAEDVEAAESNIKEALASFRELVAKLSPDARKQLLGILLDSEIADLENTEDVQEASEEAEEDDWGIDIGTLSSDSGTKVPVIVDESEEHEVYVPLLFNTVEGAPSVAWFPADLEKGEVYLPTSKIAEIEKAMLEDLCLKPVFPTNHEPPKAATVLSRKIKCNPECSSCAVAGSGNDNVVEIIHPSPRAARYLARQLFGDFPFFFD